MAKPKNTIYFQWNDSHSVIIGNLGFGVSLNKEIARICASHIDKYVPYKSGALASNLRISATKDHGTITYLQQYANKQYYGPDENRCRDYHPLATSMWDKACFSNEGPEIVAEVDSVRKSISRIRKG